MGTSDETEPSKSDKPSSPTTPEQTSGHLYPDWAAMQAYYGPRVALQSYYGAAVSSGHAPPYTWGPQPMIPPYGPPYPAVYSHTGVYGHPIIPITAPPVAIETPKKSSASDGTERGLMKKLKSFDGPSNGNVDSGDAEVDQSTETEGSSYCDRSREEKAGRKRGFEGMNLTCDTKSEAKTPKAGVAVDSPISGKLPHVRASLFEVKKPVSKDAKKTATSSMQPGPIVPSEAWLQTEKELKRERRKQSNRESARRSRMRKQAEAGELARKVESLTGENLSLKSEISRLTESSEKLRLENSSLMGKLGSVQRTPEEGKEAIGEIKENDNPPSDNTENFLSRINSSSCSSLPGRNDGEGESYERDLKKGTKLHQLLDSKPRTDAVAAS